MKLKPVYLLAPEPEPKTMTTRRAFLLAAGTFAVGSVLGGACGYTIGVASSGGGQDPGGSGEPGEIELKPSGDADLDELRRLAVKAPIDELWEKASIFLAARRRSYPDDRVLWTGVHRLSRELIENPTREMKRTTIMVIIAQIENESSPPEFALRDRLPALRRRKDEAKRRD